MSLERVVVTCYSQRTQTAALEIFPYLQIVESQNWTLSFINRIEL